MTEFVWENKNDSPLKLRTFLLNKCVTRSLLKRIKYHGGSTLVNNVEQYTNYMLNTRDMVKIKLPPETQNEFLNVSNLPFEILFENDNYLIINKAVKVATVPSRIYPNDTLVNRVLGYYLRNNFSNKTIHAVNRLDRGTSGPVVFAKNSLAHSVMDKALKQHEVKKYYIAGVQGKLNIDHANIILPLGRKPDSFIERSVTTDGKYSRTEFWTQQAGNDYSIVKVQLHTGRTHQIRVHFAAIGHPLLGDWLYNPTNKLLDHQALHCYELEFYDPLDEKTIKVTAPIPIYFNELQKK
ncbi:RNA pseudouridine synthase [Fructilactobacillus lindneri]|uniref:RluA family pseudouridine synthase n=1 Tax=Fructilactobacillus lindneri TaxID=53444 RepID=UPI000CD47283|nr:RluA family pseudouridine synthase [Fructilactobacillus lindneri]POG98897.1 RNA pseudouridine synthase [Fructilactobacillus lindneri]